jgi:hypothetical protein
MKAKASEKAFRELAKYYKFGWHKYGDVRFCIHCRKPLPKSEQAPDFSLWEVYNWVECKNSDKSGRWAASEIMEGGARENQRAFLLEKNGWLFILLGTGRAPKGKSAFLIPFHEWVDKIEPILELNKMRSIRKESKGKRPGADLLLQSYRLDWEDGGWKIPRGHLYWTTLFETLCHLLQDVYQRVNREE